MLQRDDHSSVRHLLTVAAKTKDTRDGKGKGKGKGHQKGTFYYKGSGKGQDKDVPPSKTTERRITQDPPDSTFSVKSLTTTLLPRPFCRAFSAQPKQQILTISVLLTLRSINFVTFSMTPNLKTFFNSHSQA